MAEIPQSSNFPKTFDNDDNLYLVHDGLRVRLAEDYNPGDTSITIEGDPQVIEKFPETGLITLTEQCSDIKERAISFYYGSRTNSSFDNLVLLPNFNDIAKPKRITNVTQNVMAQHHNAIKDALIAIQKFLGTEGTIDNIPFGDTLEGRINFLTKLALTPRAWFTADKRIGLVPLCVTFEDQSFRLGDDEVVYTWDFGDDSLEVISSCVSTPSGISCTFSSTIPEHQVISATEGPISSTNVIVKDLDGGKITKCYTQPGIFDVKLTVKNEHGEDTVKFNDMINARVEAPNEAVININQKSTQDFTDGTPVGGPYTTPPKIRSITNSFIDLEVKSGENLATPNRSFGGELLNSDGQAIDPIIEYTWNLNDDLNHSNSPSTRVSYSIGGLYDLQLRVDTKFGSYRITTYEDSIDIIENKNLWLYIFNSKSSNDSGVIQAHEFGLTSETFKTLGNQTLTIDRDNSFLDSYSNSSFHSDTEDRAKQEFSRNVHFTSKGTTTSGKHGNSLLFWSGGGAPISNQEVKGSQYNAFADTYSSLTPFKRPWNWTVLNDGETAYFLFGENPNNSSNENLAYPEKLSYDLATNTTQSTSTLTVNDFENGADELLTHPSDFESGVPTNGFFATYRTAWKDQTGYILRNASVNEFFRLADFYKTKGSLADPFQKLTKLPDMTGSAKIEGQLVPLTNGVFFFDNSGEISAWNDVSMSWEVGRASSASVSFKSLQDSSVSGFDDKSNTLLATSDNDRIVYLSYDYSANAFIKFNGTDLTFTSAGIRPSGTQFAMGIY